MGGKVVPCNPTGYKCVNVLAQRAIRKVVTKARNRERERERARANPEKNRARAKDWAKSNPDRKKHQDADYFARNREHRLKGMRNYAATNRATLRAKASIREKERRETDSKFVIVGRLRARLGAFTRERNVPKSGHTFELIGASPEEVRTHLEVDALTIREHQIDHIFALASYDIQLPSNQQRAMNISNMQLLSQKENKDKSDKLPTKAMAAKVPRELWPDGITEDMLPDIYPGWRTPLRM